MKPGIQNLGASVLARLKNYAMEMKQTFNEVLTYYGLERFLYRISVSRYENKFILKGALAMLTWPQSHIRTTSDMDLRSYINPDLQTVIGIMREICELEAEPDGIEFDPNSVTATNILETVTYPGIRVRLIGYINKTRVHIQIDLAFTDPVVPEPIKSNYPSILQFPEPRILIYPKETIIAEKLEAAVQLGEINTRMKDFYDLLQLSRNFEFEGITLVMAVRSTFSSRNTEIPPTVPLALRSEFAKNNQDLWKAFLSRINASEPRLQSLEEVIKTIREFLMPVIEAVYQNVDFQKMWDPDRGWI
jgi:predicted nucleotidyltransferase component of viral defense system